VNTVSSSDKLVLLCWYTSQRSTLSSLPVFTM